MSFNVSPNGYSIRVKYIQCHSKHWTTPACTLGHKQLTYCEFAEDVTGTAKRRNYVVGTSSYISIKVNLKVSDLGTAVSRQSTVLVYAHYHTSDNQNSHTAPLCYTNSNNVNGLLLLEQNSEDLQFICYHTVPVRSGETSIIFYKKNCVSKSISILTQQCYQLTAIILRLYCIHISYSKTATH